MGDDTWISAAERKPRPYVEVLGYDASNGFMFVVEWQPDPGLWLTGGWEDDGWYVTVTHWRRLPRPPEGV